jgi:L-ascorbate metabolism protein UlaG (beta-lactamase superfamily)
MAVPTKPDEAGIKRLIEALGDARSIDYILTGHSHYDHSFDTATWAKLTGARIIGARSTCLQAVAQGIQTSQCTAVEGGEELSLSDHISVRVVRWGHSGDVSTSDGRLLQAPLELITPPTAPAGAAGLRPGIVQDFPNGGGARAYLFTVTTTNGPVTWLYSNTGNAGTFAHPAVVDEAFFQTLGLSLENLTITPQPTSVQDNLRAVMTAAGLKHVNVWIGYSDRNLAALVCSILRPQAHIPHHWDGLFSPFFAGAPFPYSTVAGAAELTAFLETQHVTLLPPQQYMDKYQLDSNGVTPVANTAIKERLGFGAARHTTAATALAQEAAHRD